MSYKNNIHYKRGKRWGLAIFRSNLQLFGKVGIHKSYKSHMTCYKYANDMKIKKTKSGKYLDYKTRMAYRGMADGLFEGYDRFSRR